MPGYLNDKARAALARWIQVITLGCSLGLLIVYVGLNIRQRLPQPRENLDSALVGQSAQDEKFVVSAKLTGDELSKLVETQLAAFRSEDYARAYEMAAKELRSQIPLPAFERMVRAHYPVIANYVSARFGVIVDNGDEAIVNVDITNAEGITGHYQYILHHEGKTWKISGVTELQHNKNHDLTFINVDTGTNAPISGGGLSPFASSIW